MFAIIGSEQRENLVDLDRDAICAVDDVGASVTQNAANESVVFVQKMVPGNVGQTLQDVFGREIRILLDLETASIPEPSDGQRKSWLGCRFGKETCDDRRNEKNERTNERTNEKRTNEKAQASKPESLRILLSPFPIVESLAPFGGQILLIVLIVDDESEAERIAVQRITRQFRPRVVFDGERPEGMKESQFGRDRRRDRGSAPELARFFGKRLRGPGNAAHASFTGGSQLHVVSFVTTSGRESAIADAIKRPIPPFQFKHPIFQALGRECQTSRFQSLDEICRSPKLSLVLLIPSRQKLKGLQVDVVGVFPPNFFHVRVLNPGEFGMLSEGLPVGGEGREAGERKEYLVAIAFRDEKRGFGVGGKGLGRG